MEHCKIIAVGDNVCDKYLSRGKDVSADSALIRMFM